MKDKRPLADMRPIAEQLCRELEPYTTRCEIAGSIRRQQATVGDIEIVCVPKIAQREAMDLLGSTTPWNCLDTYCTLRLDGEVWKHRLDKNGRPACGEKFKRLLIDGIAVDLFSVLPPAQFGVLFLIRTGPATFSRQAVTPRFKGGWLPNGFKVREGAVYTEGDTLLSMPAEQDFFDFCGVKYVPPEQRR